MTRDAFVGGADRGRPGGGRAQARDKRATGHRGSRSAGLEAECGPTWPEAAHPALELRAIASLSLLLLFADAALWAFVFRASAHPALLLSPLAGFLGSWLAAVKGARCAADGTGETGAPRSESERYLSVARYGVLLAAFCFVASFLIAYR